MPKASAINSNGQQSDRELIENRSLLSRFLLVFYLAALALLPWSWFPPFPWLHEHAQWSDAVFAVAAALWVVELWVKKKKPRLDGSHAAIACYVLFAALSLLFAAPDKRAGLFKLVGIIELGTLALITSDIATRPGGTRAAARVIAATSLATAVAAIAGLMLFYAGVGTQLVGIYGELTPSPWYARMQAGLYNPNLLSSFSIFAAATLARYETELPVWLRRASMAGLWVAVLLTFSRGIIGFALGAAIRQARTRPRRRLAAVFAAACVAVMLSMTFWKPQLDPTRPFELRFDSAPSVRYEAASSSLRALAASPLWGSGPSASPGQYEGSSVDAHITLINIAATLGLPALIAFAALFVILRRQRNPSFGVATWSGFAGLALDGLAQDIEDFRHVWVLIGFADADSTEKSASIHV